MRQREIIVPDPITIRTGTLRADGTHITMVQQFGEDFLHDHVLPRFGKQLRDARAAARVYDAFRAAIPGSKVRVEIGDWEKLVAALAGDWPNLYYLTQVIAFVDAIENADEVEAAVRAVP